MSQRDISNLTYEIKKFKVQISKPHRIQVDTMPSMHTNYSKYRESTINKRCYPNGNNSTIGNLINSNFAFNSNSKLTNLKMHEENRNEIKIDLFSNRGFEKNIRYQKSLLMKKRMQYGKWYMNAKDFYKLSQSVEVQ